MKIKRRLIIDITLDCEEDDISQLEHNLDFIAMNATGSGLFTKETDAEVADWTANMQRI